MIEFILHNIKPVMLMVFLTTIAGFCMLPAKSTANRLLLLLLSLSSINELATLLLEYTANKAYIALLYSITFPLFCLLWLVLLYQSQIQKNATLVFIAVFIVFWIVNLAGFQGIKKFNYYTAALGCFGYLTLLANESFVQLKKERFGFLLSNRNLLLLSPVLLFFGFGQMWIFVSKTITQTKIFDGISLFTIVTEFVNTIYYILLITYMILEKKITKNG